MPSVEVTAAPPIAPTVASGAAMLDPMDPNALVGSAAALNKARSVARGRRGRPASAAAVQTNVGSPTGANGGLSRASSSFAAPQPPLSLSEFQEALAALSDGPAAGHSPASRPPSLPSAAVSTEGPRPPVDADDDACGGAATSALGAGNASRATSTGATEEDTVREAAVGALLARVASDVQMTLQPMWEGRQSVAQFIADALALRLTCRLGFELSLDEFRATVRAVAGRIERGQTEAMAGFYEVKAAAQLLGPEMCAVVRRELEAAEDMGAFAASIEDLRRPMINVASPQYHSSTIATLLDGEARLGHRPYLETFQRDISPRVRHILVDWLVDVAARYRFCDETLHLSINLVDRYLSVMEVRRHEVQLVGVSALFLAAKYEEIYPPDVHDLVGMTAQTYTKDNILETERRIFTQLAFRVTIPSSFGFAQAILAEQDPMPTPIQRHMVAFVLEAALHTEVYGAPRPSQLACAAVYISRVWCGIATPRPAPEVVDCVRVAINALMRVTRLAHRCPALRNKYSSSRCERVSLLPLPIAQLESAVGLRLVDPVEEQQQQQQHVLQPCHAGAGAAAHLAAPTGPVDPFAHAAAQHLGGAPYRPHGSVHAAGYAAGPRGGSRSAAR